MGGHLRSRLAAAVGVLAILIVASGCGGDDAQTSTERAPQATTGSTSARTATPALWKLSDDDTTIYLFGSFHALPDDVDWQTPELETAIDAADELVLEVKTDDVTSVASAFTKLAVSPGLPPLADRVPKDKRDELKTFVDKSGLPSVSLDAFETWAAGITLTGVILQETDFAAENGVEGVLTKRFRAKGKRIGQLETIEEQLGLFDGLSEEDQRSFLVSVLDNPKALNTELEQLLDVWSNGDQDAIGRLFDKELREEPGLRAVLLTKRNANWVEQLEKRLDTPGTVLVAVGAGHLAGPGSVQELLAKRGITVTRL